MDELDARSHGPAAGERTIAQAAKGGRVVRRGTGRARSVERERDRLSAQLEKRLAAIHTAFDVQGDLAAARGQVADLCREVERLRTEVAAGRRERRRLERLLRRTQIVARGYAERLDAAERRRQAVGWWQRASVVLAGRRDPREAADRSGPGAAA